MSAFGGKADIIQGMAKGPLIAKSGHSDGFKQQLGGILLTRSQTVPFGFAIVFPSSHPWQLLGLMI